MGPLLWRFNGRFASSRAPYFDRVSRLSQLDILPFLALLLSVWSPSSRSLLRALSILGMILRRLGWICASFSCFSASMFRDSFFFVLQFPYSGWRGSGGSSVCSIRFAAGPGAICSCVLQVDYLPHYLFLYMGGWIFSFLFMRRRGGSWPDAAVWRLLCVWVVLLVWGMTSLWMLHRRRELPGCFACLPTLD